MSDEFLEGARERARWLDGLDFRPSAPSPYWIFCQVSSGWLPRTSKASTPQRIRNAPWSALGLPVGSQVDLDLHTLSASSRLYAWTGDLTGVYGVAGVQFMLANEDADDVNRAIVRQNSPIRDFSASVHKEFGLHAGLGVERSLSRNWESFLEYRHVWHEAEVDYTLVTADPQGNRRGVETSGTLPYDYDVLRLGINYRF